MFLPCAWLAELAVRRETRKRYTCKGRGITPMLGPFDYRHSMSHLLAATE